MLLVYPPSSLWTHARRAHRRPPRWTFVTTSVTQFQSRFAITVMVRPPSATPRRSPRSTPSFRHTTESACPEHRSGLVFLTRLQMHKIVSPVFYMHN
ncbi:unnamed protein product [Schistocephalus solidus]|uniref:Uncharacterized protein n=1 Tax=Schistocephalus solidus TaxID=70667 RepID=A0A3P7C2H0_SCHSO|nr:unnamed protein product [Schistocephalus solidus]